MNLLGHDIGVCSWSLLPADVEEVIARVGELGLGHVQVALGDLLTLGTDERDRAVGLLADSGLTLTAAMIGFPDEDYSSIHSIRRTGGLVPDEHWDERRRMTLDAAALAGRLGVRLLSTHVGFLPASNVGGYETLLGRIRGVAVPLADEGLDLLMETGQESASELLEFLNNLRTKNVGVNFDPANLILYGSGDPVDAVRTLGRHIRHVHLKDALRSPTPGAAWGREVPFGDGEVPHEEFLLSLREVGYAGPLVIEREAGDDRAEDVLYAIETLQSLDDVTAG